MSWHDVGTILITQKDLKPVDLERCLAGWQGFLYGLMCGEFTEFDFIDFEAPLNIDSELPSSLSNLGVDWNASRIFTQPYRRLESLSLDELLNTYPNGKIIPIMAHR